MSAPNRTEVFVSYNMRDKEVIDPYIRNLNKEYQLRLYDSHEKPSGKMVDELRDMQRSAAGTIVFWGKGAADDERVINELNIAHSFLADPNSNKFLIIVAQPGLKTPSFTNDVKTFYMERDSMEEIMNGIREIVEQHQYGPIPTSSAQKTTGRSPIANLQTLLIDKGFFKGQIDGIFGPQTITALKEFQKQYNLPVNDNIKADDIDADFLIQVQNAKPIAQTNTSQGEPNYWILRTPPGWNSFSKQKGTSITLEVNKTSLTPAQFDLFKKIKPGDQLTGFRNDGSIGFLNCAIRAISGLKTSSQYDSIDLEFTEIFDPVVGRDAFKEDFRIFLDMQSNPTQQLLQITKKLYEKIVAAGKKPEPGPNEKEKDKKPYENNFRPFFLSEGDHKDTEDKLQFENDINSFASVISLKKVKPPLAIGLFGNWGSGKSFFMEKLYQKIGKLAEKKDDLDNIQNVVQVKFNSWHYSDANLWASLITEIFDSLSRFAKKTNNDFELQKITDTLQITTLQKEAMEARRTELQNSIRQLEGERNEKRRRLEDLSGIGLLKLIFSDKKIKDDINKLGLNATVEDLAKNKEQLNQYSADLDKTWTSVKAIWNFIKSLKGWRGWVVILSVILIPFTIFLVLKFFPTEFEKVKSWLNATNATVATVIAWMGNFIYRGISNVSKAKEGLESMKNTLDNRPHAASPELEEKLNELKQVTSTLNYLNTKIDETKKEIEDVRSGKKLLEFIEQKTRDENYSKQLGLISWIRKDFEKLDDLLRKQHEVTEKEKKEIDNPQNVTLQIDRIILYVDDLDRCKEETVVKVLEAIHLLLAFPLFVVIVGVDPRWLNNALSEKYKTLFGYKASKDNGAEINEKEFFLSGAATTYDYLEKIFQIPFTLKPIDKPGREKLIEYLLKNEMKKDEKQIHEEKKEIKQQAQTQPEINKIGETEPKDNGQPVTGNTDTDKDKEIKILDEKKEIALTFTDEERKFMQDVSPIFGHTPRGINRYVNIYRIIKAHKSLNVDDDFSADEYIPIMVILSVVVGYSVFAQDFVKKIREEKDDKKNFNTFLQQANFPKEVIDVLGKNLNKNVLDIPMIFFKRNAGLIARFSFRTLVNELATG